MKFNHGSDSDTSQGLIDRKRKQQKRRQLKYLAKLEVGLGECVVHMVKRFQ
jgi:hypothetical protein